MLGKVNVGNITTVNYSNSFETLNKSIIKYENIDNISNSAIHSYDYTDNQYSHDTKLSVLHNWAFYLGKGDKIEFRNLFNQIGLNRTTDRDAIILPQADHDIKKQHEYQFMSRSIYSGQLAGEHSFNEGVTKIDWVTGYSFANRLEPDRKSISYIYRPDQKKYELENSNTLPGRIFLKNIENIYLAGANGEHKFNLFSIKPSLKAGFYAEYKNRAFNIKNLYYNKNIDKDQSVYYLPADSLFVDKYLNHDYLALQDGTSLANEYTANNTLYAGYVGLNIPITSKINLYGGVRAEQNRLQLTGYNEAKVQININNAKLNIFPSANITYNFTERTLVRFAYGKTINRPEFREVSPFSFYDFNTTASVQGLTSLKDALIDNIDFRFEHYPTLGETYSVALFYKNFKNPIEMAYQRGQSGTAYTFQNADKATNMGVEVEVRKSLDDISLKNFSVVANGSLIYSKVYFAETAQKTQKNRALQGQSPYIANFGFYYNNEKSGLDVSLLYNIIGERIIVAGVIDGTYEKPDVYEMPRNVLDFTISKKINKIIELKFGVKDLLNNNRRQQQTFRYTDKNNVNQELTVPTLDYTPGRLYSIGLVVKL